MIAGLRPYPQLRDSGVDWLGDVPLGWEAKRAKAVFDLIDVRSKAGDEELLTVSSKNGVVRRSSQAVTMFKAESYVGHKLCWPGDLVINSLWAWGRGLGFAREHGLVSSAYSVYRPKAPFTAYADYLNALVRSDAYHWELVTRSKGVWISRLQLSDASFFDMPLVLPPEDEATAIVRFLDHADRRIRRSITAKQKMIRLLEEQKAAIIHQAVTRGLNPDAPMKSSGVDWLGDIPAHWTTVPLGRLAKARCDGPFGSGLKSSHYVDDGVRVVRLQNIGKGLFLEGSAAFISQSHRDTLGDHSVIFGDLLVAGLGDERNPAGRACIAPDLGSAIVKADCFRFRLPTGSLSKEFVALQLTATATDASAALSTGATRQRINLQSTARRKVALPPLGEQEEIVLEIRRSTVGLDRAIATSEVEIDLLREYHARLIADVVTGKLDVRAAAAALPQERLEGALEADDLLGDAEGDEADLEPEEALEEA